MHQRSTIPTRIQKIATQLSILLTMLTLIVVLAACGEASQPQGGGNTSTQSTPASGPCGLVTKEEMAKIIGKELIAEPKEETTAIGGAPGSVSMPVCSYVTSEGTVAIGWQKSQGKEFYTTTQTFIRTQPGYADLDGVGESAFTANSIAYVLKGDSLLVIANALSNQGQQTEVLKQVAQKAVTRM